MLRLSFAASGLASVLFLVGGILFGVIILAIFKRMGEGKLFRINYLSI